MQGKICHKRPGAASWLISLSWSCGPPSPPKSCAYDVRRACRSRLSPTKLVWTASYLARVEAGRPYVGLEVIGKIAEALEVEPAELLKMPSKRRRS